MDICLVTLNSTYQHTAFGLRYLYANLGPLQDQARIFEFTIHKPAQEVVDHLLSFDPKIIGFGVYIWNTLQTEKVVELLKAQRPDVRVVLGGPEVSFETEKQNICQLADHVICGEADFLFRDFCESVLIQNQIPTKKIISGPLPDIQKIKSPYSFYSESDIANRIVYVEASRGCPYKCEYCLSSLDKSVRNFPLEPFLDDLEKLIDQGARQFKFIDRTFNLSPTVSGRILRFFLERIHLGLFLHFEMVPDRLPMELRELILRFPTGSLQFEIGVQTWNPVVAALVSRRQEYAKVEENLHFLRNETGVHTHVDLIAGLPGEDLESFARGFNRLVALEPDEIQVGILKRLKGTPIIRHDREWQMVYSQNPPFQIIANRSLSRETVQKLQKFSKFWDLVANSGNFVETMKQVRRKVGSDLFSFFWDLTDFLTERHPQSHSIHLLSLFESLLLYFESRKNWDLKSALEMDYGRGRRGPVPRFLRSKPSTENDSDRESSRVSISKIDGQKEASQKENPENKNGETSTETSPVHLPKRQQQHLRHRSLDQG